jgi:hypothetical protein
MPPFSIWTELQSNPPTIHAATDLAILDHVTFVVGEKQHVELTLSRLVRRAGRSGKTVHLLTGSVREGGITRTLLDTQPEDKSVSMPCVSCNFI